MAQFFTFRLFTASACIMTETVHPPVQASSGAIRSDRENIFIFLL